MKQLSEWLRNVSTGRVTLVGVAVFMVFLLWVLPNQAAQSEEYSAEVGTVDTSFWYSAEDVYWMAEAYGEEGREAYVKARLGFDSVFPLAYTFFLVTVISFSFRRAFEADSWLQYGNLIPVVGMVFDFLENFTVSYLMVQYPRQLMGLAAVNPWLTLLKWLFVNGSFGLMFVGLVGWLWGRRKGS